MSARELCFFVPSDRPGRPWYGLNDIMQAAKLSGPRRPDRQKLKAEKHVAEKAWAAMVAQGWTEPECRCDVILTFVEMGRNRDPDNIFGGAKYVMDALCAPLFHHRDKQGKEVWRHMNGCGAIHDDSQRYVRLRCAIADETSRRNPGVWVRIIRETEEQ